MFFEILFDTISGTSPFYVYVGVIWSMVSALQLINMNVHTFRSNHSIYVKQTYQFQVDTALTKEPIVKNMAIKTWLTQKLKRMDSPDDDSDVPSFSFFYQIIQIRGGQFWLNNLYSHSLKNIASYGLF